ncbi:MAG: hypothetical protein AB7P07_10955 [Hyphomonadaceae bacterium]
MSGWRLAPFALAAFIAACGGGAVADGRMRPCDAVPASEFDLRPAEAAFANGRLGGEVWAFSEGGQRGRRCAEGEPRLCVQRNDLFVRLEGAAGARYFRVAAGETFAIRVRDGAPVCEIVETD